MRPIFCLILLFYSSITFASIGSVTELTGSALIKRGKDIVNIQKNTIIEQNDKIITKNGKLKITFNDNTTVSITEMSQLIIDEFVYDEKTSAGKLSMKTVTGTVRYVSGSIAHKNANAVKINTPTASISVRGTDFVMSVNDIGSSMIILMPDCEESIAEHSSCGSGEIEVESGPSVVTLDKPFQATIVETIGSSPSNPVIVNLSNSNLNNNLQISPPKTMNGSSIVQVARNTLDKTYDKESDPDSTDDTREKHQVAAKNNEAHKSEDKVKQETKLVLLDNKNNDALINQVISVVDSGIDINLKKLYRDRSETQQIGWLYESLSQNNRNYVNIILQMDTRIKIIVNQDMQAVGYNFGLDGRNQGQIIVNQSNR